MTAMEGPLRDRVSELLLELVKNEDAPSDLRRQALACLEEMNTAAKRGLSSPSGPDPMTERLAKIRLAACEGALSQLEQVFDSVADAVCVVDVNEEMFKVNARFLELMGAAKEDVVGFTCSQVFHGQFCDKSHGVLQRIIAGENRVEQEVMWKTPTGEERSFLLTARSFAGPGGELVGAVLSFRDVHDYKRLEKHLTETRKLESLGHLAEGLAHEINTPCQFLDSNLEFLDVSCQELLASAEAAANGQPAPGDLDLAFLRDEVPAAVAQSRSGVDRIAKIIRAMRAFAQPPTTKAVLSDIRVLVEDAITLGTPVWEPHAIISFHCDESLPAIPVFPSDMGQALLALLTNAAEAIARRNTGTPASKGQIDVELIDADEHHIEIRISDNGDGIDPKIAAKVFDMFFSTKPVGQSLGQGLAIVHAVVVSRHHGLIEHHPRDGGGTVFVLRLPTL